MTTTELGQPQIDVKAPGDDDERFWSVTTLLGALGKEALIGGI